MTDLTSPRSERVKSVRSLAGRPARSRTGTFLVEGPQGVREVVRHAPARVVDLYVTPVAASRYEEILHEAGNHPIRVHTGTPEVLDAMSADAQGILAVATTAPAGPAALGQALRQGASLVAVLATVRDPGNAGTIVRAADAAGADLVVLAGQSVDLHNPKLVRSTVGSLFHLPVVAGVTLEEAEVALRSAGIQVLAADGTGTADLDDLLDVAGTGPEGSPDLAAPTAWVFGNEAWGLPDVDRARADHVVRVPLRGLAESLNVATAATVCLYASSRAQR
ncbi:TrmH family RNA methyltransferase [Sanguibacter suaedae]|uniref:RNA methyltransferase n=1 Tax=Sanguibacter suaedae TaxID=2795737 RepID=A0A934I4H0_9MICO|nr:RNA methyltransferase [Sanguibacter suaedae]MBI9115429.1 RNA methyltransferase [Sanguibacter suaedae]